LPRVSRQEVHISGITNDLKEEELSNLIALYAVPTNVFIQRLAQSKGRPWANIKFDTEASLLYDESIQQLYAIHWRLVQSILRKRYFALYFNSKMQTQC
ncbi:hypothetical protein BGX34_007616, partial [Mortierella sp. NVP85]